MPWDKKWEAKKPLFLNGEGKVRDRGRRSGVMTVTQVRSQWGR